MRRVLVLLMLALGVVAFGPSPAAYACDEPPLPFNRQVSHAVHIFTGTVTSTQVDPAQGGARQILEVQVDEELKGSGLEETIRVLSSTRADDCGIEEVAEGDELVFFVGEARGNNFFEAVSYEGTRPTSPDIEAQIAQELAPEPPAVEVEVELTPVDTDDPPSISRAVAPGLIVALLGVVALVIGRLFGRPKA